MIHMHSQFLVSCKSNFSVSLPRSTFHGYGIFEKNFDSEHFQNICLLRKPIFFFFLLMCSYHQITGREEEKEERGVEEKERGKEVGRERKEEGREREGGCVQVCVCLSVW